MLAASSGANAHTDLMGKKRPLEFDVYRDDVEETVPYNDNPTLQ
jgi:hypothetical protein